MKSGWAWSYTCMRALNRALPGSSYIVPVSVLLRGLGPFPA